MSLPDVVTIDRKGVAYLGLWIPNPVRAKCGKCHRGTFYYNRKMKKKCNVCNLRVEYKYPGFWKELS